MKFDAIVVLGCKVGGRHELFGAAARRVAWAARAYREGLAPHVVASGGKRWSGVTEAEAFAEGLLSLGVPREHIWCEERSHTTVENARFTAELASERGLVKLCVVTCDWHMARALAAFRRHGLDVTAYAAPSPWLPLPRRAARFAAERVRAIADRVVVARARVARWEHAR